MTVTSSISTSKRLDDGKANAPGMSRWTLPPTAALVLLSSIAVALLAASSAPTALYAVYQAEWGFSPITTTVVFGIYAISVLIGLLFVGRLSDYVGRKPLLLAAVTLQIVSMFIFAFAPGVPELLVGRVLQGLAAGAGLGAVGAGLLDVDRPRGTLLNSFAPMLGTATGGLLSGVFVAYLPVRTHLIYLVLAGVFAAQVVALRFLRETVAPQPGGVASLRPDVRVPRQIRSAMLAVAPILVAAWALPGLLGSLGPSLAARVTGSDHPLLGGLPLFVLATSAALTVVILRAASAHQLLNVGVTALLLGSTGLLFASGTHSVWLFFLSAVASGIGMGGGFQGAIRLLVPLTAPHERGGMLSVVFVISYLAMGLPAVIAGILVVHSGGLVTTAHEYGAAVIALVLIAIVGLLITRRRATISANTLETTS